MATDKPDAQAAKAKDEVQAKMDDALAKGYIGSVPDPNPNDAYSPLTGPDSPPLVADNQTRAEQVHAPVSKETRNA